MKSNLLKIDIEKIDTDLKKIGKLLFGNSSKIEISGGSEIETPESKRYHELLQVEKVANGDGVELGFEYKEYDFENEKLFGFYKISNSWGENIIGKMEEISKTLNNLPEDNSKKPATREYLKIDLANISEDFKVFGTKLFKSKNVEVYDNTDEIFVEDYLTVLIKNMEDNNIVCLEIFHEQHNSSTNKNYGFYELLSSCGNGDYQKKFERIAASFNRNSPVQTQ